MPLEHGFVTNKKDTITIEPLFIKTGRSRTNEQEVVKVTGGYSFCYREQVIAVVDLFNSSFSFFSETGSTQKLVVAAAASALLLRNR